MRTNPLAILVSDIHLSHVAPIARSAEPDWYAAMARPLAEIKGLAREAECPVICAGDIFDRWNAPAELINFALEHLPFMYAVPGQHDLPHHSYADIKRSAYWTLVQAGNIKNLKPDKPYDIALNGNLLRLYAFPWQHELKATTRVDGIIKLAVVHAYAWHSGACYPGAPDSNHVSAHIRKLKGFDAAVFGDNHKGFVSAMGGGTKPVLCNCGTFMRRKSDEKDYKPQVGLLYPDGSIETHVLKCSAQDKFIESEVWAPLTGETLGLSQFVSELEKLQEHGDLSFRDALNRYMDGADVGPAVRKLVAKILDGEQEHGRSIPARSRGSL